MGETEIDGLSGGFWPVTTTSDAEQLDGGCVKSTDVVTLIDNERVGKMICSYPRTANSKVFPEQYRAGKVQLELVPQGTLAELQEELGTELSVSTLCRALQRLKLTLKKKS